MALDKQLQMNDFTFFFILLNRGAERKRLQFLPVHQMPHVVAECTSLQVTENEKNTYKYNK